MSRRARATLDAQRHVAGLGELDRVAQQVEDDLANTGVVADTSADGALRSISQTSSSPLRGRAGGEVEPRPRGRQCRSNGLRVEIHPSRLDLREVEDVVDDRQQRLAAGADRLGVVALLAVESAVQQQAAQADDRRSSASGSHGSSWPGRCSSPRSRCRPQPRRLQLGDVVVDRVGTDVPRRRSRAGRPRSPRRLASRPCGHGGSISVGAACLRGLSRRRQHRPRHRLVADHQVVDQAADGLVRGVAEQPGRPRGSRQSPAPRGPSSRPPPD